MMAVEKQLDIIKEEVAEEIKIDPKELALGFEEENPVQAVSVLIDRMDKICALMDYQSTIIENAKTRLEDAKFKYKRAEKDYKHAFNEALLKFKQEDRKKYGQEYKKMGRTDPEYRAMAELEADQKLNFTLQLERDYLTTQHKLQNAQHNHETLNNHFLSYRKSCDLLKMEIERLGVSNKYQYPNK